MSRYDLRKAGLRLFERMRKTSVCLYGLMRVMSMNSSRPPFFLHTSPSLRGLLGY